MPHELFMSVRRIREIALATAGRAQQKRTIGAKMEPDSEVGKFYKPNESVSEKQYFLVLSGTLAFCNFQK